MDMAAAVSAYGTLLFWGFAFLATHLGIASSPLRGLIVNKVGEPVYLGLYSLLSLVLISLFVSSYNNSSHLDFIWTPIPALHWVLVGLMPFTFILLMAGVLSPNPSIPGGGRHLAGGYEVKGIFRVTRHPVQWAICFWALLHIMATGDQASFIFFSSLAFLSSYGTVLMDKRKAKQLGEAWRNFADMTSNVPFAAILGGRQKLVLSEIGWLPTLLGLIAFAVLWFGHVWWPVGTLLANPFTAILGG